MDRSSESVESGQYIQKHSSGHHQSHHNSAGSNRTSSNGNQHTHRRDRHSHSSRHRSSSVGSSGERSHRRHKSTSSSSSGSSILHRPHPSAKTTAMHDDTDAGRLIPINQPALAIDYLGSSWNNEDDIAASWKFMTKQKNDLINGLRLENASWRNWAKQRHHLKTISPKALNWLKESDTTWLYGPLYKAAIDEFDISRYGTQTVPGKMTSSTTSSESSGKLLKPVLKHKTASELFKADTLFHVQSDLKLFRKIQPNSKANESAIFKEYKQPKLRFNDSVEQCVSIDVDVISEEDDEYINEFSRRRPHMIEDDGLLMRISGKRPIRCIVRIDPTKLKAANFHGMEHEIIVEHEPIMEPVYDEDLDEDLYEEELFDEPIYLGNPYNDSGNGYVQPRQHVPHSSSETNYIDHEEEFATAEVSYTSPLPPSPPSESSDATAQCDYGLEVSSPEPPAVIIPVEMLAAPATVEPVVEPVSVSKLELPPLPASLPPPEPVVISKPAPVTTPKIISLPEPIYVSTFPSTTVPTNNVFALRAAMRHELSRAAHLGYQQRVVELVVNMKDLVTWASSIVYNSNTF
ncbi:hypothetical protein BGZ49_001711 [Haplosporangium sp. Z 27]|nr:hypothetical protein BGZ49_001711 [Haplosporangium sp. Z 27]